MVEFFENLKQKRIENGIELKKIAEKTLLNLSILIAIESGEIDKLPKGYRRIYLRRYVKEIGLNPDEVMKDYALLIGDTDVELIKENVEDIIDVKQSKWANQFSREKLIHNFSLALIGLVIIVVIILIYFATKYISKNDSYEIKEIPVEQMALLADSTEKINTLTESALPVKEDPAEKKTFAINLEVSVTDDCWIKQVVDYADTSEYILKKDMVRIIQAHNRVKFIVGRGEALIIRQNGRTFKNLAPAGSVIRRLVLDKNGIVENIYILPEAGQEETADSTKIAGE